MFHFHGKFGAPGYRTLAVNRRQLHKEAGCTGVIQNALIVFGAKGALTQAHVTLYTPDTAPLHHCELRLALSSPWAREGLLTSRAPEWQVMKAVKQFGSEFS